MKKKKIFLGAYINYLNAQNINCKSIATNLDKDIFEVFTMTLSEDNYELIKGVNIFNCFKPHQISIPLAMVWGLFNCDVIYFPKHHSTPRWILILANLLGKKIFTTIEANMCDKIKERNMIKAFGGQDKLINHFSYFTKIFPITKYILDNSNCGVHLNNKVLYLGVDRDNFVPILKDNLRNIVFIGSLVNGKGVHEFVQLAKIFTKIKFNVIGDGPLRKELESISSENVVFHGMLPNDQLKFILHNMDLHVLLSKSEGFPKVILETASSGIPSILYSDYGAVEWINHRKNGFVINNIQEVIEIIKELEKDNVLLLKMSKEATNLSRLFDWKLIIKDWENVINNLEC